MFYIRQIEFRNDRKISKRDKEYVSMIERSLQETHRMPDCQKHSLHATNRMPDCQNILYTRPIECQTVRNFSTHDQENARLSEYSLKETKKKTDCQKILNKRTIESQTVRNILNKRPIK